jgi:glycosyltransferase involved in cell wall biosynthesis
MAVSSVTPGLAGVTLPLEALRGEARPYGNIPIGSSRVSVVIPTLNEERNIGWVLEHLPATVDEVILVDGRSTDRTVEVAQAIRPDIVIVREKTPGKGAALRAAFAAATGDVIVMLDADCSMDPAEIPAFVAAIEAGADVAKGSRFLDGGGTVDISALRQLGNGALLRMTNILYRARFSELCYGYMAFRRSSLMGLGLRSTGFEIETEIVVRALRAGLRITEVPSFEAERRFGNSNLRTFRDGWRVARTVLRERFARASATLAAGAASAAATHEPKVSSEV